jgi:hypothetical protein
MKKLTVTFQNKTISYQTGKLVKQTNGNSYCFYGATKKECEQKARDNFRWSGYSKQWEEVANDEE